MAKLSPPTIFTPSSLQLNPSLTSSLTTFITYIFDAQPRSPRLFDHSKKRFSSPAELLAELGSDGVMCVTFDRDEDEQPSFINGDEKEKGEEGGRLGRIVACAGAVPWDGEGAKEGDREDGWALKTVCVDPDEAYAKRGLAVRSVECLARYLTQLRSPTEQAKYKGTAGNHSERGTVDKIEGPLMKRTVTFWLTTEECLNGEYWRRRGFTEVRRTSASGIWAIREGVSVDVVTMRKEFVFED